MFVGGHDPVDLCDRQRQAHDTLDFAVHADGRYHPRGGRVELRLIRLEVGDPNEVNVVGTHRLLVRVSQIRLTIRAGEDVGSEVGTLHDAVDDVALRVQE